MKAKPVKPKKCRVCKTPFTPYDTIQNWCSPQCGFELSRIKQKKKLDEKNKAQKRKDRQWKKENESRGQLIKKAQQAVNAFVRVRDAGKPCISSGRPLLPPKTLNGQMYDAGHYRSTGSCPELRFNLWNIHGQTVHDNRDLSGNAVEYRKGLIERIGIERVEWIESNHEIKKYTKDDLRRIATIFRKRTRLYERQGFNRRCGNRNH
jgi:hypothetical protein